MVASVPDDLTIGHGGQYADSISSWFPVWTGLRLRRGDCVMDIQPGFRGFGQTKE